MLCYASTLHLAKNSALVIFPMTPPNSERFVARRRTHRELVKPASLSQCYELFYFCYFSFLLFLQFCNRNSFGPNDWCLESYYQQSFKARSVYVWFMVMIAFCHLVFLLYTLSLTAVQSFWWMCLLSCLLLLCVALSISAHLKTPAIFFYTFQIKWINVSFLLIYICLFAFWFFWMCLLVVVLTTQTSDKFTPNGSSTQ